MCGYIYIYIYGASPHLWEYTGYVVVGSWNFFIGLCNDLLRAYSSRLEVLPAVLVKLQRSFSPSLCLTFRFKFLLVKFTPSVWNDNTFASHSHTVVYILEHLRTILCVACAIPSPQNWEHCSNTCVLTKTVCYVYGRLIFILWIYTWAHIIPQVFLSLANLVQLVEWYLLDQKTNCETICHSHEQWSKQKTILSLLPQFHPFYGGTWFHHYLLVSRVSWAKKAQL